MKNYNFHLNKHIELVKKWLDDPDSVTLAELKANRDNAYNTASYYATAHANDASNASAVAYKASDAAYYYAVDAAAYWVRRYTNYQSMELAKKVHPK